MIFSDPHDCAKFYLDNLEDELTITALQMLVQDLLILFQAVNEGVINVLGNNPD
jgi:phosphatidylinositol-binding clathrin assembly protein